MPTARDSNNDSQEARDAKRAVLDRYFRSLPPNCVQEAVERLEDHLNAVRGNTVNEVRAGCDFLRDNYENTFAAPTPAHLRGAARQFARKNAQQIESRQHELRMAKAKRERMTPAIVRAELKRLEGVPLQPGEASGYRAGLARILARWEGEEPVAVVPVRKRGEGGLNPISEHLEVF